MSPVPPIRIHLHVAIPSATENAPIGLNAIQKLKLALHHRLDWWSWRLLGIYRFKSYNYSLRTNCNKGDIAIKVAIKELIESALSGSRIEFVETEWGCLTEADLADINASGSVFVVAGGGYWVFNSQGKLSPSFSKDIPFFVRMKCPLVVFGSGVNFNMPTRDAVLDFDLDAERKAPFEILEKRVDLLSLRGETSVSFFKKIGSAKARLLPDPAVFLKAIPSEPAPALGRGSPDQLHLGINLAFHGSFMEEIFRENFKAYVEAFSRLKKEFNLALHYFSHSDHELIIPKMFSAYGIDMHVVDEPASVMTGIYAHMDAHICQMMHSNILSFNAGVPALNVGYDSKNFEFNSMIGMEEYCLPARGLDAGVFYGKATDLIANRKKLALKLSARKECLRADMDSFLADFRALTSP